MKIPKSKQDNGDHGEDNAGKLEVNASKSDEPLRITEKDLPPCQVILTRCDGWTYPGWSSGAVKANGNIGQKDVSSGIEKSKSGLINSEIHNTNSRRLARKQTGGCPVSTRVGVKQHIMCQLCSKSFGTLQELEMHTRVHTGERPYMCKICSKSFKQAVTLKIHIRIHTGERPYECQFCSKSFGQPYNLKTHIRIHTGERPHKCHLCSKSFVQKGALNDHIRTHTGERAYKCGVCSKSFGRRSNLKRHITTHSTK